MSKKKETIEEKLGVKFDFENEISIRTQIGFSTLTSLITEV